jgi:hypothetical protein
MTYNFSATQNNGADGVVIDAVTGENVSYIQVSTSGFPLSLNRDGSV